MKAKEISRYANVDSGAFELWLKQQSKYKFKTSVMGAIDVDESQNLNEIVDDFKRDYALQQQAAQQAAAQRHHAEQLKQQALAGILITTGFNFEGYSIVRYAGYISGDDVIQVDRGRQGIFAQATDVGASLMASMGHIRTRALNELREAAHDLGCNAVIGVDFDYLTLDPETVNANGGTLYLPYVFGVTANGTAVVIQRASGTEHVTP